MIVLGISPLDRDATVTLMADGRILFAAGEERLSRQKMHAGFPHQALEMALARTGVRARDIDQVAYAFLDADAEAGHMRSNLDPDRQLNGRHPKRLRELVAAARARVRPRTFDVHGLSSAMECRERPWWKRALYDLFTSDGGFGNWVNHRQYRRWVGQAVATHQTYQAELLDGLRRHGLEPKLRRYEHHQTHVANAFYPSGFDRALVVTLDGYGTGLAGTVSVADERGIRRLHQLAYPYSLGTFYESVTSALGMRPGRHEGKVVGLAAWGDPEVVGDVLRSLFVWGEDGGFAMLRSSDLYLARRLAARFPKIDVAAAYQKVLEEVACRYVRHFVEREKIDTLVLSGGVTANVKLNQRLYEIPGVRRVYVHPNMGDGGCGTGAALLAFVEAGVRPEVPADVYYGPEYAEADLEKALNAAGVEFTRPDDIETEVARLVAADWVVARYAGRMEYGPRALGNRSILYQARNPEVNQWLNHRLGRTEFMPFAPATLFEDRHQCYVNVEGAEFAAQFMTVTFDCTPWMRDHCPAAVHVDGTARPQLVTAATNPGFHRILTEYKKLTGIPSLINTSFNMHEEPIICTPEDAIRGFQNGRLDYLALGNYLVPSPDARQGKAPAREGATL